MAVTGPAEGVVVQALEAAPGVQVVRRCADLAEAVGAASAGLGSVVVVSDQPHLDRVVVEQVRRSGVAVVGIAATPETAEQLRSIGVAAVVSPQAAGADIAAQVDQAIAALAGQEPTAAQRSPADFPARVLAPDSHTRTEGELVAVWGPTGAPGRTTIAVNVAAELAREGRQVLIVDADTYGGAVAQAYGITDEAPGLAAVARVAHHGQVDTGTLARHARELAPRLRVLTGITRAERWAELPAPALDEVWRAARAWADVTVVDCGFSLETDEDLVYDTRVSQRNAATLSALAAATQVIAVGSAEPLGLQRLVHALPTARNASTVEPVVVINRVRSAIAGARPEEAVADALVRFAQVTHAWMVPWDGRACDAATLAGQTLAERAPKSKARKAIAAVAGSIAGHASVTPAPGVPPGTLTEVGH